MLAGLCSGDPGWMKGIETQHRWEKLKSRRRRGEPRNPLLRKRDHSHLKGEILMLLRWFRRFPLARTLAFRPWSFTLAPNHGVQSVMGRSWSHRCP